MSGMFSVVLPGKAPLSAVKVLALCRNVGGTTGSLLRLVPGVWDGTFSFGNYSISFEKGNTNEGKIATDQR